MAKIILNIQANDKATASVQSLKGEVEALGRTLSSIKVNKNLTTQINALTKHYNAVAQAHAKITANTNKQAIADEKLKQQQTKTSQGLVDLQLKQQRLENAQKKTTASTEQLQKKFANLLSTIKSLKNAYPQGTFDSIEQSVRANLKAAQDGTKGIDDLGQAYNELSRDLAVAKAETEKVTTAVVKSGDSIGSLAKKFLLWQVTATLVMKPLRLISDALSSINETLVKTEDAVIALQRVLPSGSATDGEISSRLYKIAQDYGQTFENVQQIATNFARTGMSWADTIKATEAAVLALNVAELDAEEASDGLISILTQFNKETSDLTEVVDKLNKAADNNPVTTEKLLKALQRTGAAAKQANISLDETVGIITTLSKATNRSGENLGTAVNSLIQFSSKASSLDTFAKFGGSVETAVEKFRAGKGSILQIWEELGKVINDKKAEGLLGGIFSDDEWAGLNEELKEALGEAYADVTDIYDTASTFRKNYFIALLNDMDNVKKVTDEIADANGYSQAENQKYLDTYTAKLNTLKAQWEDIANSEQGLLGIKKVFVDIGSALLTASKWTGGLRTALIGIGSALATLFAPQILKGLSKIGDFFKNLSNPLKNFKLATQAATKAQQAQTLATNLQAQADRAAATANQVRNTASASGAAIESAETAAIKAQTVATQAQARADELAATAAKAKGAAFQTVLGIIGIGVTVISAVVGAIQEGIRVAEENRKQTIENYRTIQDTYEELRKLNGQYKELADNASRSEEQEKDFNEIENKLVELLKDKYKVLSLLTEGTDEYTEAVKRLADEEEKQYGRNLIDATAAAEKGLADAKIGRKNSQYGYLNAFYGDARNSEYKLVKGILDDAGLGSDSNKTYLNLNDSVKGNNLADQLYNYAQYSQAIDALQTAYNEAVKQGDYEKADKITNSQAWKNFKEAIDSTTQLVNDYFDTKVALLTSQYETQFGEVTTQEQFDALQTWVQNQINAGEYYNETINNVLAGLIDFGKLEPPIDKFWSNNIQDVKSKYDGLIETLKELRDLEDESANLEEKKAEYLEAQNELIKAQQALENAKNEATVRRFNEATGQWEWQVDEKKVQSAEEAVKKQEESVEKAREQLEKQAYDTIISLLDKNNPPTNDELVDLLDGLKDFLGEQFITDIKEAFLKDTNVDLDKPINEKPESASGGETEKTYSIPSGIGRTTQAEKDGILNALKNGDYEAFKRYMPSAWDEEKKKSAYTKSGGVFDSGGIANGLGFMAKATAEPEVVNAPDIARQILNPVSNKEFETYTKQLGIMFEQAHNYARMPQFERVNNTSTDNSVNNSGQINFAGGLTVGSEQRDNMLNILSLAKIVPNS